MMKWEIFACTLPKIKIQWNLLSPPLHLITAVQIYVSPAIYDKFNFCGFAVTWVFSPHWDSNRANLKHRASLQNFTSCQLMFCRPRILWNDHVCVILKWKRKNLNTAQRSTSEVNRSVILAHLQISLPAFQFCTCKPWSDTSSPNTARFTLPRYFTVRLLIILNIKSED